MRWEVVEAGETPIPPRKLEKSPIKEEVSDESEPESEASGKMDHAETFKAGLASIRNDIRDLKQELRNELTTFKD